MKIVALQGSPRANGNTQALLDFVLKGAREAGAAIDVVQLSELRNLTGCEECYVCQEPGEEPACAIEDDMQDAHARMLAADVIVWATPVFCFTPSWLLKMAMDRTFCMFRFPTDKPVQCALAGRKMAAVVTFGGDRDGMADLTTAALERLAEAAGCTWLGACIAGDVTDRSSIRHDTELRERAREFGRTLAGAGPASVEEPPAP